MIITCAAIRPRPPICRVCTAETAEARLGTTVHSGVVVRVCKQRSASAERGIVSTARRGAKPRAADTRDVRATVRRRARRIRRGTRTLQLGVLQNLGMPDGVEWEWFFFCVLPFNSAPSASIDASDATSSARTSRRPALMDCSDRRPSAEAPSGSRHVARTVALGRAWRSWRQNSSPSPRLAPVTNAALISFFFFNFEFL